MRLHINTCHVLLFVGDQAVCLGDSLPASCVWYPSTGAQSTQEECLPQCLFFIHMDMCTISGQYCNCSILTCIYIATGANCTAFSSKEILVTGMMGVWFGRGLWPYQSFRILPSPQQRNICTETQLYMYARENNIESVSKYNNLLLLMCVHLHNILL